MIERVRKVVEHLHKSANMRARFEELQLETEGKILKLLQDQAHRWLGTVRLLERFLLLWDYISVHYHRVELRPFPVEPQRKLLVELFSLMKPVAEIIISAQSGNSLTAIDTFLAMCNLYPTILDDNAPLPLRDPALAGYNEGMPVRYEQPTDLETITRKTRRLLRTALMKRFYESYNGTKRSLCYEMQVFLHPSYRKLACLERFMEHSKAEAVRTKVKASIRDLALLVAETNDSPASDDSDTPKDEPCSKKHKKNSSLAREGIWNFSSFEELDESQSVVRRTIDQDVMDELDGYLENERVKAADLPSRKLLTWWKSKVSRYPNLSVVARSILAHPASAAAIERDFGISGMVLHPCRNRTDASFVDMQLFLRAHITRIPATITELPNQNGRWMDRIPNRFTGIEPIENLALTSDDSSASETSLFDTQSDV